MKSRTVSFHYSSEHVTSLVVQCVILNKPCGEHSSNSIKIETHRAAFTILSRLLRTIQLERKQGQRSEPLMADNNFFFRMTSLSVAIVIHWKNTKRPPACQQHKNQFPWQRWSLNFQVVSVTEADIRWVIIVSTPTHLYLASASFSLTFWLPTELSCTITAHIIHLKLCLLLPLIFPFLFSCSLIKVFMSQGCTPGLRWET